MGAFIVTLALGLPLHYVVPSVSRATMIDTTEDHSMLSSQALEAVKAYIQRSNKGVINFHEPQRYGVNYILPYRATYDHASQRTRVAWRLAVVTPKGDVITDTIIGDDAMPRSPSVAGATTAG